MRFDMGLRKWTWENTNQTAVPNPTAVGTACTHLKGSGRLHRQATGDENGEEESDRHLPNDQ